MSDLLGVKLSAANMKRQMKPSKKEKTKTKPTHQASREERDHISKKTGKTEGDIDKNRKDTL